MFNDMPSPEAELIT